MYLRHLLLVGIVVPVFACAAFVAKTGFAGEHRGEATALKVSLALISEVTYGQGFMPLRVSLENVGEEDIRILRSFYGEALPVFFSFKVLREDGTPVLGIRRGGKIDLPEESREYLQLKKHEGFYFRVDLAGLLTKSDKLRPGRYRVSVTYHNQYGVDCFRGLAESKPVVLEIH